MRQKEPNAFPPESRSFIKAAPIAIVVLALLGAAIRIRASLDELWLDEVWSIVSVLKLRSPVEILTRLTIDNNHPLNSLFIWLIGGVRSARLYRLPALSAGLATLALAAVAEWPDRRRALLAELLTAVSTLLVVYSTEARGYALAAFFALGGLLLCERYWEKPGPARGALLGICIVLGLLSHLSYVYVFAALLALSLHRCRKIGQTRSQCAARTARLFLPPAAATAILYGGFLSRMIYGGGPKERVGLVLSQFLESLATGSEVGHGFSIAAFAVVVAFCVEIFLEWKEDDRRWPFFAAIVLAPLGVVLLLRPPLLYPRYFLVCVPFLLLLLSRLLVRLFRSGEASRALFAGALFLLLLGNTAGLARLLTLGRGHYLEGVLYMARHSRSPTIRVTSDHDFRNGMLLDFYAQEAPRGIRFDYVSLGARTPASPEWLIRHSRDPDAAMPERIRLHGGGVYVLARICPFWGGLSGFSWFIYRLVPAGT
jgi:hypothetical protein